MDMLLEPWPPKPTDITQAIAARTDSLVIERLLLKKGIALSRLTEKLTKAAGVAGRQTAKIEARADAIIARESSIEQKTNAAFGPHEALLTEAEKGLDTVESALNLLTNGGDPLPVSGASSGQGV